ncbi:T9SS type B sorting domain-containing protein [Myroides fluvii]|uniref:T9SS type B sorting domain-containing protein n=1 Tax=Myroides fluvii TaxID=2572594 RepID=UPI00131ABC32|nr:T9SS type B sorting domain-containing protein [Myroides fluvii]
MKRFLFFMVFLLTQMSFFEAQAEDLLIFNGRREICSGTLYDDGGLAGNYQPLQRYEMVLCPDTPGGTIRLDFTSFLLAPGASLAISSGGQAMPGSPFTGQNSPGFVSSSAADGCMTLVFTSDDGPTSEGFSANIMCQMKACQNIEVLVPRTVPAFDPNTPPTCPEDLGVIKVCSGSEIKLYGDAIFSESGEDAVYKWTYKFDRRTVERIGKNVTYRFDVPGAYRMRFSVTDRNGCEKNKTFIIQVASSQADITLTTDKPVYCLGEPIKLGAVVELEKQEFIPVKMECVPVDLPDVPGVFFTSAIEFDYYCDTEKIERPEDIIDLWMEIVHGWAADLDIIVFAPNGASMYLTKYINGNRPFDTGITFGNGNNVFGIYNFSDDADFPLQNRNGNVQMAPTPGSRFPDGLYKPWEYTTPNNDFSNFIGAPLNGIWRLQVEDKWQGHSGRLKCWDIAFDERFQKLALTFQPVIANSYWMPHPDLVMENGQMVAKPLFPGEHTYTYVVVDDYGCTHTKDITVTVQDAPVLTEVHNLQACIDAAGVAEFDLNDVITQLNINDTYNIKFYNSERDAQANNAPIALTQTLNTAVDGFSRTVWVRVDRAGMQCYAMDSFELLALRCELDLNELPNLSVCSELATTTAPFDLTVQTPRVYNNNPNYEVLYFLTQEDANLNRNAIPTADLTRFIGSNGQTIWVRVQNRTQTTEFTLTSFQLFINQVPTMPNIGKIFGCPIEGKTTGVFNFNLTTPVIIAGRPNVEVVYFRTVAGAINNDASEIIHNTANYESATGTIGVRLVNLRTGCYGVYPIELEVAVLAEINDSLELFSCSLSTAPNGIGEFDLRQATISLLGDQVSPYIEVKYFRSITDANQNINAIGTTNFVNTVPFTQTIYARVAYARSTCFQVVPVLLTISPKVVVPERIMFSMCVDNPNREMIVDLTTKEAEITAQLNGTPYRIDYYTSRVDAENSRNSIVNPENYSSALGRSVWAKVEDLNTGCFSLTNIVLTPILMPVIPTVVDYQKCEDPALGQGYATFDLLDHVTHLIGIQLGLEVRFYGSRSEAERQVNALPNNYVNIQQYEQTVYVRFNSDTGCTEIRPMKLKALTTPVLNIPTDPVAICSVNNDGFGVFDLMSLVNSLQNGDPNIVITFYETEQNALAGVNAIPNPNQYNNITANNAIVYVRGELAGGCFTVKPLHLTVVATPLNPIDLPDLVTCSDDPFSDMGVLFNLRIQDTAILAAQNNSDVQIQYFLNEPDALARRNAISNPERYVSLRNNQTIWYRVTSRLSSCFATGNFKIIANVPLAINNPLPIEICQASLPNTGRGTFDLTIRELDILGRVIDRVTFDYYLTKEDALANRNAIANPRQYPNTGNPQTIWVAVNSFNGCRSYTSMTIKVLPLPNVNFNPKPIYECDSSPTHIDGLARFDLTVRELEIANQSANYSFEYYNTKRGAEERDRFDRIIFPDQHLSGTTTVWVRVNSELNGNTGCAVLVPLQIGVKPVPVFAPVNFLICEENTSGFHNFNMLDKLDEILNGENPADFDVYFYLDRNDAERNNIGVAIQPQRTNQTRGFEQIFVRVVRKESGCHFVGVLNLIVEEKVFAFDISLADKTRIEKCASPAGSAGTATFDLNLFTDEIIIGQNIDAANLGVQYYYKNVLIDPAQLGNFRLPIGTHEIVAVVKRPGANFFCQDETRFTLTVFETPIAPVLAAGPLVCIDYTTKKLLDPYTIDSGFKGGDYEFQWERRNATGGIYTPIAGATKSYYVVESIELGNVFRVVVKFKGQQCSNTSNAITLNFVEEIKIKITNADSKGILGAIDGEERISIIVEDPKDARLFEYALDEGAYQDSKIFYDVLNGTHRVWVRYKDQRSICPQYVDVFVLGYPRFFTPNGDGFNDTWNIPTLQGHPEAVIYIYDRYGKLLTQFTPANGGWDGTFNGKQMPSTDYWFTVEYLEEAKQANQVPRKVQYKGHFSLKR